LNQSPSFPVDQLFPDLKIHLDECTPVMLKAAPGAGKTTRIPLWLLEQTWLKGKKVIMLEPRRLAARNAAEFMAAQINESVGHKVGYRVRLEHKVSANTQIEVVTEAMLTGMLIKDPELKDVGCLIFDEFHERNASSDIALGMVLEMRKYYRDDLRLIIMSATMNEDPLLKLIQDIEVLECEGRQYPLQIDYQNGPETYPDCEQLSRIARDSLVNDEGDILIFLPGKKEIAKLIEMLSHSSDPSLHLYPLHGQLSYDEQRRATSKKIKGTRSIIVATDIAETSLTIPGIRVVIDSGFSREVFYDSQTGGQGLRLSRISKDSADQRAGRAGREAAGKVYRAWSRPRHNGLMPMRCPEIENTNLEKTVLEVLAWGSSIENFPWVSPPSTGRWKQACSRLEKSRVILDGELTEFGESLLHFPMEPRLARLMLVGKKIGCGSLAALVCTWWNSRVSSQKGVSDWEHRLEIYYHKIVKTHSQDEKEFRDACRRISVEASKPSFKLLGQLLLKACPERLAMRRPENSHKYLLAEGGGVSLHKDSSSLSSHLYLYCPIVFSNFKGEPQVSLALAIDQKEVDEIICKDVKIESSLYYDEDKARVVSCERYKWMDLVVKEVQKSKGELVEKSGFFWEKVQKLRFCELPLSENAKSWLQRYRIMSQIEEDVQSYSDIELMEMCETWLKPYMSSIFSWKDFSNLDWDHAIKGIAAPFTSVALDESLPSTITVPSGSKIAIDYSNSERPILSVRIQEIFGMTQLPLLLKGKIKLTIELLSPARRPIQITSDLNSFWKNGYFEIRKDLKRRYPKHAWPDEPLEAQALRGVKRK